MYSDFHIHSNYSGDSETPAKMQAEKALILGMESICFTDHHDYDMPVIETDFTLDTPTYINGIKALAEEFAGRLDIRLGVELGLQPHLVEYLKDYTTTFPFDFIIGSQHLVEGIDPYYPQLFEMYEEHVVYEKYFQNQIENARLHDCYDVFGHLDYVVRYGPNQNLYYSYKKYQDVIDELLKTLISKGKGIEINTGGLKYGLGHPNPHEDIIRRYIELGGEIITLGSDAHVPEHLGYQFDHLPQLLASCGIRYYTVFKNRQPIFYPV